MVCEGEEESGDKLKDFIGETEQLHLDLVEVPLNSLVGFIPNNTMKVRGNSGNNR
ncbi:hypothetical protein MA16_Dca008047 [Dendrobium catenatum]|uniref:Uncharacterized protein n=1 Tax=Dendrobium catenatum TaxID=906689 RepID=A0A2I0WCV9_9ASPA|nr:hypothetical protein MA16_Dca008047 [Dendrobium catenatum]